MSNPAFKFDHVHIISEDPRASAEWYVEMFGATIRADTIARGAPQIFVDLGGMTILIRGRRPGEDPQPARPIRPYADFSSYNAWGTDHFGFLYQGDLTAFCAELRAKGVTFLVPQRQGGELLQEVQLTDADGALWLASYRLQRQADGSWRINGCELARLPGEET